LLELVANAKLQHTAVGSPKSFEAGGQAGGRVDQRVAFVVGPELVVDGRRFVGIRAGERGV
jgi:hypothetical protein